VAEIPVPLSVSITAPDTFWEADTWRKRIDVQFGTISRVPNDPHGPVRADDVHERIAVILAKSQGDVVPVREVVGNRADYLVRRWVADHLCSESTRPLISFATGAREKCARRALVDVPQRVSRECVRNLALNGLRASLRLVERYRLVYSFY
jgi:hypothetical protein